MFLLLANYLALMKLSRVSPIMYSQGLSLFANNAVSMAADIIRKSSFMQRLSDIKECDVEIKIIYCLDEASTVNHFIGGRRCRLAKSQTLHFQRKRRKE